MAEVTLNEVIVCQSALGWVLDPIAASRLKFYDKLPEKCVEGIHNIEPDLFTIEGPFLMDSQYEKLAKPDTEKKKKSKRKAPLNDGEIALQTYYDKVKSIIQTASDELLSLGKACGYFKACTSTDHGNNAVARNMKESLASPHDTLLSQYCWDHMYDQPKYEILHLTDSTATYTILPINTLVLNDRDEALMLERDKHYFAIPPKASFLCSDIHHIETLIISDCLYDVILMDPPWENKSVKRKDTYYSLSEDDLVNKMPLGELMAPGCIVAVWVTNRQAQQAFVRDTLFPKNGITFLTQWYWLKVTVYGEPVGDLESQHKKPFESLMIGRYSSPDQPQHTILEDKVLMSVPCVMHSYKPPLHGILEQLHPKKSPRCLELFARYLTPGWTSWGNEVVKFQDFKYLPTSEEVMLRKRQRNT